MSKIAAMTSTVSSRQIAGDFVQRSSPKDALLPPLYADPLTQDQWRTLYALIDAAIPSIHRPGAVISKGHASIVSDETYNGAFLDVQGSSRDKSKDLVDGYLRESILECPELRDNMIRIFSASTTVDSRVQLKKVLTLLNSRPGALVITGYATPFAQQPLIIREKILGSWETARLPMLRMLFRSMTTLAKQVWVRLSPTLPRVLGYSRTPQNWKIGRGFNFEFLQIPPDEGPQVLETDAVIVGSGCGAAVCAKNLAEAGHRVMVVDKAYHWPSDFFPMTDLPGFVHLYLNGGTPLLSDDSSIAILAGQAWGGGGTVNWSASLQTQGYVRKEWARNGLPFFTSAEYQTCLDRVCHRMGVSADFIKPNFQNATLLEGARQLGWTHKLVPQNTAGSDHLSCGASCTLGCSSCDKKGPSNSFLTDAASAGAQFMEGFDAREILFDKEKKAGKRVAIGVRGIWTSRDEHLGVSDPSTQRKREVIIRAKKVIVSCGTMASPLLLMRSGLKNPHIGRHLYTHPVQIVAATYDDQTAPWEGGILTSVVSEFENLDQRGHGVKLEATCMLPGFFLSLLPWSMAAGGGLSFKTLAAKMSKMVGYIAITRDEHTTRVYPDPNDGRVRIDGTVSTSDRNNILTGVEALARICHTTGATEIISCTPGVPSYTRPPPKLASTDVDPDSLGVDEQFDEFLRKIHKRGLPHPDTNFPSAHQMGTCRMAATARDGVVDPHGKVFGTEGLYIADASVFPSASGVNPMVSNMATSDWISRWVERDLRRASGVDARL